MKKCFLKHLYLIESDEKELDCLGFEVLMSEPDKDNTIPTRRISDGQYACLPLYAINFEIADYEVDTIIKIQSNAIIPTEVSIFSKGD